MNRYFIDSTGRVCGEVLVENPVNPLNHGIIESEELSFPLEDYLVVDGIITHSPKAKTPEELLKEKKQVRKDAVNNIKVTTSSGKIFDGDEESQTRLTRAIQTAEILGLTETVWVLATNDPTLVTLDELKEALALSMKAMGELWIKPYE